MLHLYFCYSDVCKHFEQHKILYQYINIHGIDCYVALLLMPFPS